MAQARDWRRGTQQDTAGESWGGALRAGRRCLIVAWTKEAIGNNKSSQFVHELAPWARDYASTS